jgi:O-antigen ligase
MNKFIQKYFGSFNWFMVSVFLITLPLIWADKTLLDVSLVSRQLALSILILLLSLSISVLIIRKKFTLYLNKTDKIIFGALSVYMLIHLISSFGVINYQEAVFRSFKEFGFMLWLFFLYQLLRYNPQGREVLIKSVIVMGSVFAGIGVYQIFRADFSQFLKATENQVYYLTQIMNTVYSTCSNKNLFAEILFLMLPFSVYGIIIYKRFWRILSVVATFLYIGFILMLLTRSVFASMTLAILAAGIILVYYFFRVMPKQGKEVLEWIKISFFGIPVMTIITVIVLLKSTNFQVIEAFKEKLEVTFNSEKYANINEDNPSSTRMRIIVWGKTIQMIKEHPLIGVGPGQWQIEMPKFGLNEFEDALRQGTLLFQRPHSDFLWIASEEGILGLICYLVFYIGAIVVGIRNFLTSEDKNVKIFNFIAAVALIGWMVDLSTNYPHERIEHNMIYLLIPAIIFADIPAKEESKKKKKSKINFIILAFLPLIIFNIYITNQFYQGEKSIRKIKILFSRKYWTQVVKEVKKTEGTFYTLDNFTTPIYYYKGIALATLKNYKEANQSFAKAYELNPYHLSTLANYGTSFDLLSKPDMAIEYYKKAIAISPRYKEPLVNLAKVYYNKVNVDKQLNNNVPSSSDSKNIYYKNNLEEALNYIVLLPFDLTNNPMDYKKTYLTICRRISLEDRAKYDPLKFKEWFNDENKITATFLKYKNEGGNFKDILLVELKK